MEFPSTTSLDRSADSSPKGSRASYALLGLFGGAVIGATGAVTEYFIRGRNLHEVALTTYLLVYPLVGLGICWFGYRNRHAWRWVRLPIFSRSEPLPSEEAAARGRLDPAIRLDRLRAGIATAVVATALDFAWRGWPFLSGTFISGMLMYPYCGMGLAFNMSLRPGDSKPSIRHFRVTIGTLMVLVAHFGLLCGVGTVLSRFSQVAQRYHANALNSRNPGRCFSGPARPGPNQSKTCRKREGTPRRTHSRRHTPCPESLSERARRQ